MSFNERQTVQKSRENMKRENIALVVSILALLVSVASIWSSYEVQRQSQTVAFEQRRQEVRQLILQGQLLTQQVDQEVRAALREEQDPQRREELADVHTFDTMPATADTSERLNLERVGGKALETNQHARDLLETLRSARLRSK